MKSTDVLINLNISHIEQGITLLEALDDDSYLASNPPVYSSGIGDHVRHILEHYQTFLAGIERDSIDYDARQRDTRISTSRGHARLTATEIVDRLSQLSASDRPIRIKVAVSGDHDVDSPLSDSSLHRELQYLQAHTIHHYALIALIARFQGVSLPNDFGVAPSTLRHRQALRTS